MTGIGAHQQITLPESKQLRRFQVVELRSLALSVYAGLTLFLVNRVTRNTDGWQFVATLLRLLAAGGLAAGAASLIYSGLAGDRALLREVVAAGLASLAGLMIYALLVLRVFRIYEAVRLERGASERVGRFRSRVQQWLAAARRP